MCCPVIAVYCIQTTTLFVNFSICFSLLHSYICCCFTLWFMHFFQCSHACVYLWLFTSLSGCLHRRIQRGCSGAVACPTPFGLDNTTGASVLLKSLKQVKIHPPHHPIPFLLWGIPIFPTSPGCHFPHCPRSGGSTKAIPACCGAGLSWKGNSSSRDEWQFSFPMPAAEDLAGWGTTLPLGFGCCCCCLMPCWAQPLPSS